MSSSQADRGSKRRERDDAGFSLIEIIVALGITTTIMIAVLPQLVIGLRTTALASNITSAKGVAQGQLERMRNLPYHVAPSATQAYVLDVLDQFFPNRTAPSNKPTSPCMLAGKHIEPQASWTGFVNDTARCTYEPATGAFYRKVEVRPAATGPENNFVIVTDTQFLNATGTAVTVPTTSTYDAALVGKDRPPSTQIGVTVTVLYADKGTLRPVSTYTQMAENFRSPIRMQGKVNVTALDVGSLTPSDQPLAMSAGQVNITGALSRVSTVTAGLTAAAGSLATGDQSTGAFKTLVAPPTATLSGQTTAGGGLSGGCDFVCWGPSALGAISASAESGLPNAGTSTAPLQSMLTAAGNNTGLSFRNTVDPLQLRPGLKLQQPLAKLSTSQGPGASPECGLASTSYLVGGGFLNTTADSVSTCAAAASSMISFLPTDFAPAGLVQITLEKAWAKCSVTGPSRTVAATNGYSAVVRYFNGNTYVNAGTITTGNTVDPLPAVLAANPVVSPPGYPNELHLQHYIGAWSSATTGLITSRTTPNRSADVSIPGVVTISSRALRQVAVSPEAPDGWDIASVVSMKVGAVSCFAEDTR